MNHRDRNNTIESVLVLVLLVFITLAIFLLLEGGSNTYNNILKNKVSFENARIVNSYINIKIKQNDYNNSIYIKEKIVEGEDAIVIEHNGDQNGLITYIFFYEGSLYECYIDKEGIPSLDYSEKIISIDDVTFSSYKSDKGIIVKTSYIHDNEESSFTNIFTFRSN